MIVAFKMQSLRKTTSDSVKSDFAVLCCTHQELRITQRGPLTVDSRAAVGSMEFFVSVSLETCRDGGVQ